MSRPNRQRRARPRRERASCSRQLANAAAADLKRSSNPDGIRSRELNGFVELPKSKLKGDDRVRIIFGLLAGRRGRYAGEVSHQHIKVLLQLLGAERQVRNHGLTCACRHSSHAPNYHRLMRLRRKTGASLVPFSGVGAAGTSCTLADIL